MTAVVATRRTANPPGALGAIRHDRTRGEIRALDGLSFPELIFGAQIAHHPEPGSRARHLAASAPRHVRHAGPIPAP